MIRYPSLILLLLLVGCTPKHYITKDEEVVAMYLDLPKAKEVLFASSLDNFKILAAHQNGSGLWVINTLNNREFRYFYVVDGEIYIPECRYREKDDFGTINCIYQQ
jgi:hypothetical protein